MRRQNTKLNFISIPEVESSEKKPSMNSAATLSDLDWAGVSQPVLLGRSAADLCPN